MEQDLHGLLAAARNDAPPPRLSVDDITAAGRRLMRRRRRNVLLSSVAGGVAAVITGATAAVVLFSPSGIAPAVDPNGTPGVIAVPLSSPARIEFAQVAAFETSYAGYTVGKYTVGDPDLVTADYQESSIRLGPAAPLPTTPDLAKGMLRRDGRLVVFRAGAFDPREFLVGEKIPVGAGTALLRFAGGQTMPTTSPSGRNCCEPPDVPTIAWQYSADSWAAVYWSQWESAPSRDELVALAGGLTPAKPRAFQIGFRLKDVAKGYQLVSVSNRTSILDSASLSVVRLALKAPVAPLSGPVDFGQFPAVTLSLGVTGRTEDIPVGKTSCPSSGTICAVLIGDGRFYLQVEGTGGRPPGASELSMILKAMSAEQPDDPSGWPAATEVFPY